MITQGDGNVDLAAVAADDALLDLLGARAEVPADDTIAGLLAAFADEVDDGLAALLASAEAADGTVGSPLTAVPAVSVVPDLPEPSAARSHGLRATTIALVVGATLSVSGVAAAVTGDPFSPYRGIVSAVTGGDDESAAHAARMAWLQRQLTGTRAKVAHGDLTGAATDLTRLRDRLEATDGLSHGRRTALEARITALEAALARAQDRAEAGTTNGESKEHGNTGSGPAVTPGPNSTKTTQPQSTKTPEPQNTKVHQPQNTKAHQPQNTKTPDPQSTRVHQPQNTKKATPDATEVPAPVSSPVPEPEATKKATPRNTKNPTPQSTRKAESQPGSTAAATGTDEPATGPAPATATATRRTDAVAAGRHGARR